MSPIIHPNDHHRHDIRDVSTSDNRDSIDLSRLRPWCFYIDRAPMSGLRSYAVPESYHYPPFAAPWGRSQGPKKREPRPSEIGRMKTTQKRHLGGTFKGFAKEYDYRKVKGRWVQSKDVKP